MSSTVPEPRSTCHVSEGTRSVRQQKRVAGAKPAACNQLRANWSSDLPHRMLHDHQLARIGRFVNPKCPRRRQTGELLVARLTSGPRAWQVSGGTSELTDARQPFALRSTRMRHLESNLLEVLQLITILTITICSENLSGRLDTKEGANPESANGVTSRSHSPRPLVEKASQKKEIHPNSSPHWCCVPPPAARSAVADRRAREQVEKSRSRGDRRST